MKKSIQRDDAGRYTCEIQNHLGIDRANLSLFIQCKISDKTSFIHLNSYLDAPEIDRSDPNQNRVAVDSERFLNAKFYCHISALPKPTIIWLKVS